MTGITPYSGMFPSVPLSARRAVMVGRPPPPPPLRGGASQVVVEGVMRILDLWGSIFSDGFWWLADLDNRHYAVLAAPYKL